MEQLRPDLLENLRGRFGSGGLRRLLDQGAYYPSCRHLASTFSASTLATLATGTWPAQHGIVADLWYDRAAHRTVRASDEMLLAPTLSAAVAASPRRRSFAIGSDAASARLFAGGAATGLYWMDERCQFTARGSMPDWLVAYNRQKPIENFRDVQWRAMDARKSAPPLRVLKYDPARPDDFFALYRSSPFSQMAQFEFLAELVNREKLGQEDSVDFVCLMLGSSARLGYETGAHSPLMEQMVLQLDQHVAFLFEALTRSVGDGQFNIVLAAGHGVAPAPSQEARPRMAVSGEALAQAVQKAFPQAGGPRVEKYVYPFLYLDPATVRDVEPLRVTAANAAAANPAVAAYYTAGGACPAPPPWNARLRNSFHPQRSGDVMLSYRPEYIEDFGGGRGVSYGSVYNYDVETPLCFWGPQFRAGTREQTVESVDFAPTLARALGVGVPASAIGRVLGEAFDPKHA